MSKDNKVEIPLTEEQLDAIADKIIDKFYARVGQSVLSKLAWAVGVVVFSLLVWLASKGRMFNGG